MVQLKFPVHFQGLLVATVLIPVWCNWNVEWIAPRNNRHCVLIPVWCNWNHISFISFVSATPCFNSCMVQLKWNAEAQLVGGAASFNSCMVQLKSSFRASRLQRHEGFNSCMVQLKFFYLLHHLFALLVLIPVWCNWNNSQIHKT